MGSITTGIGLVSGIDIATLIDSIITIESASKFRLQSRAAELQVQQTALLDINARLLNFKSNAESFRVDKIFESVLATSSNEEVLTATAKNGAKPGSFDFIVKQLVSSSQMLSKGYTTQDSTPLGLSQIAFEFGNGRVTADRALEDLNGGDGVDRGRIVISDRNNSTATIDLTDVTNLDEVVDRINTNTSVSVTATIDDDHLVITDTSGGSNNLTITDNSGDTTATDLGIAQDVAASTITGTSIYSIGANTALATLNDGNGVLVRDNVDDFIITTRDASTISIDLGRIDLPIDDNTLLSDLNNGAGVKLNDDTQDPDIKFVDRAGNEYEVDLTGATTVGQLKGRIATATGGVITLSVTSGDRFTVTDTVGGALELKIEGAGSNGEDTANDLGILNTDGVSADTYTGTVIPAAIDQAATTTVQDVLDRINNDSENGGKIVATIGADGTSITLTDFTLGIGNLSVASTAANPSAASDLGIETSIASNVLNGSRLIGGLDTVLVSSLNGGSGLDGGTTLTLTDRAGVPVVIATLDLYDTLGEIVDVINTEAQNAGAQITASINTTGNSLKIVDTSGGAGNLIVAGDASDALGVTANVAADTVRGTNLQRRYVSHATRLEDLNYGRGIGNGSFRITDGIGQTTTVNINGTEKTLYDVILEINSANPSDLAVKARINDNGDGIIIEEDAAALGGQSPSVKIKVQSLNGTAAADLGILGEADDISDPLDGSYEKVVALSASDSLESAATKINDAGIPVSVSIVNTGGGASPYRLSFASEITGASGDMTVDLFGGNIGLTSLARGQDAKVFFGSKNPEDAFLVTSSTNSLDNVLNGVSIDLLQSSSTPVNVTITRDETTIVEAAKSLATTFNDAIGRLDQYDFYDIETEEKGVLLGNATVANVRSALYRIATGPALNVGGGFSNLFQVGFAFNSDGEMTFDEAEFREAYAADPQGVKDLFTKYATSTTTSEQVSPGISVQKSTTTFTALGFGDLFANALEDLTNSTDGVVTLADDALDDQLELIEDRIEFLDARLAARRNQLLLEFTAMETTLARLQSQSGALGQIASNVSFASSQFSR